MSTRTKTADIPRGEVVQLERALLRDRDLAAYLSWSVSKVRAMRLADGKGLREGRAQEGIPWVVIGKSVFYRKRTVDAWVDAHSVLNGQVQFSNRPGTPSTPATKAAP